VSQIETYDLTKRFRELRSYRDVVRYPWERAEKVAVDSVTISVDAGEVFGVLGQNGAGKTTLIRMLSTSLRPTSGSARVAGHDVVEEPHRIRQLIGLVGGEERSFEGRLSGRENLEFFAALQHVPRDVARRRIDELLRRLDLAGSAHRLFETYSAGMRQKMAIARGLVSEPLVLFMDEPTRALDPISAREVRDLVAEYVVGELQRTVVLATHSLREAEELCDRLILIKAGRVIAGGTVDELRRSITAGVRCELRLSSLPEGLLEALEDLPGVLALDSGVDGELTVLRLTLTEDGPALASVLRETVEAGADVFGCSVREPSLEDVYVEHLGSRESLSEAQL
jgi:ABC-2 type transport system ATP-binding protein